MAWCSSRRTDDPGQRSPLSRGPERCGRKRRGRGEAEFGSPAPCQLHLSSFEAFSNMNNGSEGGIKGDKESSLKQRRFFFFYFSSTWEKVDRDLQWAVWLTATEKNLTKPQRVCSCRGCIAALLHLFAILLPSPRSRRYASLFWKCSWFIFSSRRRGAVSHKQRPYILWLCQLCPAWSPQSLSKPGAHHMQNVGAASYMSFLSSSWSGCLHLSLGGGGGEKKKKERERKDQSVRFWTSCGARWKWKQSDQWNNRWGCNWSAFSSSSLE